ncbi:hypothetical protein [Kitasatospora phosalacinea]|uniref:Uncharacterized protein n=1 Tax=Kitasatospora phosalacinea TaxID=2065 RepID=A0A9W6PII3_9ACTN|nr:hypothetical protein [Kitasatospora phosalacinea]GLW56825.1 hypothetical protein Kpho01_48360 [Kitasatospora phosalacinea]
MVRRLEFDEGQAIRLLGVPVMVWRWARCSGLVPVPDLPDGRWSRAVLEGLDVGVLRASVPPELVEPADAADRLAAALGTPNVPGRPPVVSAALVANLVARGVLADLSGNPRYVWINPEQVDRLAARPDVRRLLAG